MRHLKPDELLDVAEGSGSDRAASHLAACEACRDQVAQLQLMMSAAAGVDVPEPSPLFWDHLSARVREAVATEAVKPAAPRLIERLPWFAAMATGLAAVMIAAYVSVEAPHQTTAVPAQAGTAPAAAVAAVADVVAAPVDDASLDLLAGLAEDLDWDSAAEAGISTQTGAADRALAELTDDERVELQRLLNEALGALGTKS